jgi:hypothetical protein
MRKTIPVAMLTAILALSGCAFKECSGKGGMTKYSIKSDAYEYHYKNGFTGKDAMGWGYSLQYARSRAGTAVTCDITSDKSLVLSHTTKTYGQNAFVHELNGINFYTLKVKK